MRKQSLEVEDYIDGKIRNSDWQYVIRLDVQLIIPQEETVTSVILISLATRSYKNMKVGLDCANGSSWMIAKSVFDALGAKTYVINAQPDGLNINMNAGSTHIEVLAEVCKRESA